MCKDCGLPSNLGRTALDAASVGRYVDIGGDGARHQALTTVSLLGMSKESLDLFIDVCLPLWLELNQQSKFAKK